MENKKLLDKTNIILLCIGFILIILSWWLAYLGWNTATDLRAVIAFFGGGGVGAALGRLLRIKFFGE